MNRKISLLVAGIFATTSMLQAATEGPLLGFKNIRQKAMGNVGVTVSEDDSALVNNPAGLAFAGFGFKMPRVNFDTSKDSLDNLSKIQDLANDDGTESEQMKKITQLIPLDNAQKIALLPAIAFTAKGFGAGVYADSVILSPLKRNGGFPELAVEGHFDNVPVIGYGKKMTLLGGTAVGISLKHITRTTFFEETSGDEKASLNTADILKLINDKPDKKEFDTYEASGIGVDLGLIRPMPTKGIKGNVGLVVQNLGATLKGDKTYGATGSKTTESVERKIPTTVSVGANAELDMFGMVPIVNNFTSGLVVAADYMIVSPYSDAKKNLHAGIEKKLLFNMLKLRGGINQGYFVGGVGFDLQLWKLPLLHLSYADYTEEFGEKVGENNIRFKSFEIGLLF